MINSNNNNKILTIIVSYVLSSCSLLLTPPPCLSLPPPFRHTNKYRKEAQTITNMKLIIFNESNIKPVSLFFPLQDLIQTRFTKTPPTGWFIDERPVLRRRASFSEDGISIPNFSLPLFTASPHSEMLWVTLRGVPVVSGDPNGTRTQTNQNLRETRPSTQPAKRGFVWTRHTQHNQITGLSWRRPRED